MQDATPPSLPSSRQSWLVDIVLQLVFFGFILALFIYLRPLAKPDSLDSLEIAREMLLNHHWITPTLNGVIQLDFPPLFYWLTATSFSIFGITTFAARFWPAIFGLAGMIMLYSFARWYDSRRMGWICAAILGSGMLYLTTSISASPYIIGTVLLTASLCSVFSAIFVNKLAYRNTLILSFWLSCALNTLLLGISGLILPLIIISLYCWLMGFSVIEKAIFSIRGVVLYIAVTLPWFYLAARHNPHFLYYYFIDLPVLQYVDHLRNAMISILIIIFGSFAALLPWSILMNLGYWACRPVSWKERFNKPLGIFIFVWLSCTVLYLIGISSLHLLWISLLSPVLTLAFAKTFNACWETINPLFVRQDKNLLIITLLLITALFFLFSGETVTITSPLTPLTNWGRTLFWNMYGLFLLGGIACYLTLRRRDLKAAFYVFTVVGIIWTCGVVSTLPTVRQESMQTIQQYINTHKQTTDILAMYQHYYPELALKTPGTVVMLDWQDVPAFGYRYQNISGWNVSAPYFWQIIQKNERHVFLVISHQAYQEMRAELLNQQFKVVVTTPETLLLSRVL